MEPDVSRVTSLDQDMIVLEIFTQKIGNELENILKSVDLYKKSITHLDDYNREKDFLGYTIFSHDSWIVKYCFKYVLIPVSYTHLTLPTILRV